jgi:hypothetical protein
MSLLSINRETAPKRANREKVRSYAGMTRIRF